MYIQNLLAKQSHPIILILAISILIRTGIGFSGYSGVNDPITKGDFEAHRNWMSITHKYSAKQWYNVSESHWKLDYPPVCAYMHLAMSYVVNSFYPQALERENYEDEPFKYLMRTIVIVMDVLIYFTSIVAISKHFYPTDLPMQLCSIFLGANIPSLLLIDHGHFHFNSIMIGLSIWSFYFIEKKNISMAIVCYVLSVNFKQMSIYYGLPLVIQAIVITFESKPKIQHALAQLTKYAVITISLFAFIWSPWLLARNADQTLRRIFPIMRGLWEDKVSNFWLFLNLFIKIKNYGSDNIFLLLSLCIIIAFLCLLVAVWWKAKPSFMLIEFLCSMTFFMFAFQVHEKTLLLPLAPFALLFMQFGSVYVLMMVSSSFSMYNLLSRDNCSYAYFLMQAFCYIFIANAIKGSKSANNYRSNEGFITKMAISICKLVESIGDVASYIYGLFIVALHTVSYYYPNPLPALPDFWYVVNIQMAFIALIGVYAYGWLISLACESIKIEKIKAQ